MSKFSEKCATIDDLMRSNNESEYNLGQNIRQEVKDFILDEMKAYGIDTKKSVGSFNFSGDYDKNIAGIGFRLNEFSSDNISFTLAFSLNDSGNITDSKIGFSGVSYKTNNLDDMLYIVDNFSEIVDNCIAITQDVVEFITDYNI